MQIAVGGKPLQGQIGDVFYYGEFSIVPGLVNWAFEVQFSIRKYPLRRIIISEEGIIYEFRHQIIYDKNGFEADFFSKDEGVAFRLLKERVVDELEQKLSNVKRWENDNGSGTIEALLEEWTNKEF